LLVGKYRFPVVFEEIAQNKTVGGQDHDLTEQFEQEQNKKPAE
jgi:hypothetical protein